MGIVHSPSSDYGKELRKWEQHHTQFAIDEDGDSKPGNPYVYREYPAMLYRAQKTQSGKVICCDVPPNAAFFENVAHYERACLDVARFNASCQLIVKSAEEREKAHRQGWSDTPTDALAKHEALEQDMAQAAAESAFSVRRMSDGARREHAAADASTHAHVVDVQPKKKRGRPSTKAVAPMDKSAE